MNQATEDFIQVDKYYLHYTKVTVMLGTQVTCQGMSEFEVGMLAFLAPTNTAR